MRPSILFPLFAPLTSLKGVGPRMGELFLKLCGDKLVTLLFHLPSGVVDRSYSPLLTNANKGCVATLRLTIEEHIPPQKQGRPYRIIATDNTDQITITFFSAKNDYLEKIYPIGKEVIVSGTLERFGHSWSMTHPDYALSPDKRDQIPLFEPTYPLTAGITSRKISHCIEQILERTPELPEWHDESLLKRENWQSWRSTLKEIHSPSSPEPDETKRHRLAYDELLADQLALAVMRRHHKNAKGHAIKSKGLFVKQLIESLPFQLTGGQLAAFADIKKDMESDGRMLRLLQGDVGSGKTIVALLSMLHAVEAGLQTALMAPTEILAKQHAETLSTFLKPLDIDVGLVTGKGGNNKARQETLERLEKGDLSIAVGTHALFQKDIQFKNLGLAIMDEQHRFGVTQRLQLAEKGKGVDILVMTATPIPRTLTLTSYGDMDISRMTEKPAGRKPVDTRLIDMVRLDEVIAGVKRQMDKGAQIYWVCPLIEESEKSDLAAATDRADLLVRHFGKDKVGLIHGRLKAPEKEKVMQSFIKGDTRILVATTVIEVGVDVPNASLMIVEHSERFGLAQLHQLRGRVGRGATQSTCLLLYQAPLGDIAKSRLKMMRESEDGFRIAEEDLRLRGPGEVLGTRQSGVPTFRMANLITDRHLLKIAHDDAKLTLNKDPALSSERGKALKILLYLFEKDSAVKLFRSG